MKVTFTEFDTFSVKAKTETEKKRKQQAQNVCCLL